MDIGFATSKPSFPDTIPQVPIVSDHDELRPYQDYFWYITNHLKRYLSQISEGFPTLLDFANCHQYYGCQFEEKSVVFREWLPAAKRVFLYGEMNEWKQKDESFEFRFVGFGKWELRVDKGKIQEGQKYRLIVETQSGQTKFIN